MLNAALFLPAEQVFILVFFGEWEPRIKKKMNSALKLSVCVFLLSVEAAKNSF